MYEQELEVAMKAAELAAAYLRDAYERFQPIPNAPASISTEADRRSQEIILQHLATNFPQDGLCAEEATETLKQASSAGKRLWIVDPIDGTRGFARKNGEFSIMIALLDEGQLALGIVSQPAVDRLTYAMRGEGCWRRDGAASSPVRCQVRAIANLREATLTQSRSKDPSKPSALVRALKPANILESYSAGIKLAFVARGEADLYLNTYEAFHDWDIAAGHILVSEAGGRVTGTDGTELKYGLPGAWQRHGLLASNGTLHELALEKILDVQRRPQP